MPAAIALMLEGETSTGLLTTVWTEVTSALTVITSQPLAAAALALPLAGGVIVLVRKIFKRA